VIPALYLQVRGDIKTGQSFQLQALISVEIVNFYSQKHVKSRISIERLQKKRYFERKVVISVCPRDLHTTAGTRDFAGCSCRLQVAG